MEQEPKVSIHPLGPTPGVKPVYPSVIPASSQCETSINIGLFFDGTGNNKDWDNGSPCHVGHGTQFERRKESNVARLFFAYPNTPAQKYYPFYIPGVGTPFPQIGEIEPATTGMAFGGGGDGRINFGLLQVLNSIQLTAYPSSPLPFSPQVVLALCRNGHRGEYRTRDGMIVRDPLAGSGDEAALRTVGMSDEGGLLMDTIGGDRSHAVAFYRREVTRMTGLIKKTKKPKLVEIFIDVFGFSRGAAEARTFCSWLDELFEGDTLCGVRTTIRFLGIFDTVASVGIPNAPTETYGLTNGHMAWGAEAYLRIPARVKNCVHFVAMHENRSSFPLDRVWVHNGLPSNCHEYAFPGMHSDVGGGYGLVEQGRGRLPVDTPKNQLNSEKLSQVPLDAMLKAAQVAKVPLNTNLVRQTSGVNGYNPFQLDDGLKQAYSAFHAACAPASRQPADWLGTYLAWRYQVLHTYTREPWFARANADDRNDLVGANAVLIQDIQALEASYLKLLIEDAASPILYIWPGDDDAEIRRKLAPEADDILKRIKHAPKVSQAEALLFSAYAHDSVAGFRPFDHQFDLPVLGCTDLMSGSWEPEGYLRYRRFYTGYNSAHTYALNVPEWKQQVQTMKMQAIASNMSVGSVFGSMP